MTQNCLKNSPNIQVFKIMTKITFLLSKFLKCKIVRGFSFILFGRFIGTLIISHKKAKKESLIFIWWRSRHWIYYVYSAEINLGGGQGRCCVYKNIILIIFIFNNIITLYLPWFYFDKNKWKSLWLKQWIKWKKEFFLY